jgi:uncharacterized linocin/CFP29 family protein
MLICQHFKNLKEEEKMEFLHREEAPLTESQWKEIDNTVIRTAKSNLVGRRFIEITPALDPAIQSVAYDIVSPSDTGACGLFGDKECDIVKVESRKFLPVPQIYKDFKIHWRDIETSKKLGIPLDMAVVAAAARQVAVAEDTFIFNGDKETGYPGLLNVEGRNQIKKENFDEEGGIFKTAVKSVETLNSKGFSSNLAFVTNPKDYSKAFRIYGNSGVLEINHIKELFDVGVFSTFAVPEGTAVAVSTGIENMDLFVVQDIITSYLAYENMDHYFRVFELIAFRIKNPLSVVVAK